MTKETLSTHQAPAAIGAYSQAVRAGDFVYVSGQIPLVPEQMNVVSKEFVEQTRQVFKNLQAIAQTAGGSLQDAIKLTVYLTDLSRFAELNDVMAEYVAEPYPARAAVQVSALPKAVQVEIDAVLYLPQA